jgi:hypothetical protein
MGGLKRHYIPIRFKKEAECPRMEKDLTTLRIARNTVPTSGRKSRLSAEN